MISRRMIDVEEGCRLVVDGISRRVVEGERVGLVVEI